MEVHDQKGSGKHAKREIWGQQDGSEAKGACYKAWSTVLDNQSPR